MKATAYRLVPWPVFASRISGEGLQQDADQDALQSEVVSNSGERKTSYHEGFFLVIQHPCAGSSVDIFGVSMATARRPELSACQE
jgi:hypothetical protein